MEKKKIKRTRAEQQAHRKQYLREWYLKNRERILEKERLHRQQLTEQYEERIKKNKHKKKETSES